jgi:hypothetical protein
VGYFVATRALLGLASAHQATRSAQAAHEQRAARIQQSEAITHTKATIQPGQYRTPAGDVVQIKRTEHGRIYALTHDPAGGWQRARPERVLDALNRAPDDRPAGAGPPAWEQPKQR